MIERSPGTNRPTALQWMLLALLLCAAAALRLAWIGSTEAHWDELWHMELSTGRGSAHLTMPRNELILAAPDVTSLGAGAPRWTAIPRTLDSVTHPPLYTILLRFWRSMFGESVAAARAFSALVSALCVYALFEVVRILHGPSVALWAAAILTVASAQIDSAQEVRNYALASLFCLCAAASIVRIEASGISWRRVAALFTATLAAMFTHYFTVPVLGALALYAMLRMPRRAWINVVVTLFVAGAIFAAVWGPKFSQQATAFRNAAAPGALGDVDVTASEHAKETMRRLAAVPVRLLFEPRKDMTALSLAGVVLFALPWLLVIGKHRGVLLWAIWITTVIGMAAALDLWNRTRHLDQLRHTILAGPAVAALLAAALARPGARPILAHGLPAVIVLACVLALGTTYTRSNARYSDLGAALADADAESRLEPVIFTGDPRAIWKSDVMYLGAAHYSGTFPRAIVRADRPLDAELIAKLRRWPSLWIVVDNSGLSPDEILPGIVPISKRGEPFIGTVWHVKWETR